MNPEVYVLDEPSANLDINAIKILKAQLKKIKESGKTIVIAEHRIYYLADLIDKVIYMEDGKVSQVFKRKEFLNLDENQRIKMGLRTIKPIVTKLSNYLKTAKPNLIVSGLSYKNDKKYIFKDMNFSAAEGEVIGVLGNNGVGKTTLMRCLAGLIKEGDGKIKLNEIFLSPKKRNKVCYMIMQDVNHQLFAESVWDECKLLKKKVEDNRVLSLLKEFNLEMYKENHPMALSGGQKQRLAIVTGILADKKILIFDEPTSGLDYENMCTVSRLIKSLSKEGHIIFIVTHDEEFLEITCDRVIQTCN